MGLSVTALGGALVEVVVFVVEGVVDSVVDERWVDLALVGLAVGGFSVVGTGVDVLGGCGS